MNKLLILFVLVASASVVGALPLPDRSKQLYQKQWGGTVIAWPVGDVDQVAWPVVADPKQYAIDLKNERARIRQEIDLKEIKRGSLLMFVGMIAAGLGFACHFLTAYPIVHKFAYPVMVVGGSLTGAGMFMKKVAEYQGWIVLAMVALIAGGTLWKCRKWSFSHLFEELKRKPKDGKG